MLVDFSAGKTQLALLDQSINTGAIDMKMDGSVHEEKSSCEVMFFFCSESDWGSYLIFIAKTASKKISALIHSMEFVLLWLLCTSINLL